MAAAGATIIGRVAVKVIPDTTTFRRDLFTSLRRIEQRAEVRVRAVLAKDSRLERDVLEKVRDINAMNRTSPARQIRLFATLAERDVNSALRDIRRRVEERSRANPIKLATDLDGTGALRAVSRLRREVQRLARGLGGLQLDVDLNDKTYERIKKKLEELEEDIEPKVMPDLNEAAYRWTQGRLAWLSRPRMVQLIPVVSRTAATAAAHALARLSGARLVGSYFERMWRQIAQLDKRIPTIANLSMAVASLAGWAATAFSNIFALAGTIAQMAQASLALPGILGGFAFGIGATIAVFRDFNEVIPEVGQRLTELQKRMSDTFWKRAEEPIRNLVDVLLPQFEKGLVQTSDALATFFGALSDGLAARLDGHIQYMFDNLNESITIASRGMDSFAQSLTVLGKLGSEYLPRLADWFVRINDSFANWLTAAEADGRLREWVENGIEQLGHFGRALRNTGRILRNLFQIAEESGGSTLSMFADTLGRVADVTGREPFRSQLIKVLSSAHEMMSLIAGQSGPAIRRFFLAFSDTVSSVFLIAGEAVGRVLGGIADALAHPAFQAGLRDMFIGLSAGLQALIPALEPVARGLGSLGLIIGQLARNFGPILATAFGTVAQVVEKLTPVLLPLIDLLGSTLRDVLNRLSPLVLRLADAFAKFLGNGAVEMLGRILPPLTDALIAIADVLVGTLIAMLHSWADVMPLIATAVADVMTAITPLIPQLGDLVATLITHLMPVITDLASTLFPALAEAVIALVPPISELLRILTEVLGAILPVITPIVSFIVEFLGDTLVTLIEGIAGVISGVLDIIKGVWEAFAGLFSGDWGRFWEGIKQVGKGIWDLIVGAFKIFISVTIFKLAKLGLAAIKGLWNGAWNGIKSFGQGIWNSIRDFFGKFMSHLGSKASSGINAVRNFLSSGASRARELVIQAFRRLRDGAVNILRSLVDRVRGIKDSILGALSNIGSWLFNSGRALIQGLVDGVKNAAGWAKDQVSNVLSGIRNLFPFSPAKEGPFSGKGWTLYSGQAIAEDLAKGMLQRAKEAKNAAEVLAKAVHMEISEPKLPKGFGDSGDDDPFGPAAGAAVVVNQTIHNPVAEKPSTATNKGLQTAAALGLV